MALRRARLRLCGWCGSPSSQLAAWPLSWLSPFLLSMVFGDYLIPDHFLWKVIFGWWSLPICRALCSDLVYVILFPQVTWKVILYTSKNCHSLANFIRKVNLSRLYLNDIFSCWWWSTSLITATPMAVCLRIALVKIYRSHDSIHLFYPSLSWYFAPFFLVFHLLGS